MSNFKIPINTVLPGWGPSEYFISEGQFQNSLGIDPEMPRTDALTKPSGLLRPTAMSAIGTTSDMVLWLEANSKNTNLYGYGHSGQVYSINSGLTSISELNSGNILTSASGNGMAYYNNYYYFAKNSDVCRYGPLTNSPAFVQDFWTSALSLTALADPTMPAINGIEMPNHPMHVHPANNRLYFGDVNSDGVGILSMIKTKKGTYEGDTNDTTVPSAYNVLDTYFDWRVSCLGSLENEIAVGIVAGTNTGVKQANARVLFWSTLASDTSYNREAILPDPLVTAIKNVNGQLYVFSGSASGGMRISRYLGGQTFEEVFYSDDMYPPLAGSADFMINRLVWGASTTSPATSASVMALGGKARALSMGVHNILKTTSTGTSPMVTSLAYFTQGPKAQPTVAWKDGSSYKIDKLSTTYGTSIWRSQVYSLGERGMLKGIRIPLAVALGANMTLTVKVYVDDALSSETLTVINSTNFSAGDRYINLSANTLFKNNFFVEFTWSGSALMPVNFPIVLEGKTFASE